MTNNSDSNSFFKVLFNAFIIALFIVLLLMILSSCKLVGGSQKQKSEVSGDTTSVKKQTESLTKGDTSKSKTETIHTKETIYQPQPIYIQGKDGETKVIFVPQSTKETGSNKSETLTYTFEDYRKDFLDSVRMANLEIALSKKSEIKVDILPLGFWFGLALVGLVLIGVMVMVLKMRSQFTSINNLLTKK